MYDLAAPGMRQSELLEHRHHDVLCHPLSLGATQLPGKREMAPSSNERVLNHQHYS
jgi:hypothetical protein